MKKYLTTNNINGRFYFSSNLIEINNYDESFKQKIERILALDIDDKDIFLTDEEIEILSIIYHEITHFLDLTTTTWGIEYFIRKINFLNKKDLQSLEVFKLNVAEIEMHNHLIEILKPNTDVKLLECLFEHTLLYDKDYGALIMVVFSFSNERIYSVPFSMLSLLESSAYSSEILIKIHNIEKIEDEVERTISLKILENEFNKVLNDITFSEYNLVLLLAKRHFPNLNIKELLTFVKVLIRLVLNLGGMHMSWIATFLKRTFIEKHIGNAIINDIQRGMSRHIIVFKFVLLMYGYLEHESTDKEKLVDVLKQSPIIFINSFMVWYTGKNQDFLEYSELNEFDIGMKSLKKKEKAFDTDILLSSSILNKQIIESETHNLANISNLKLLDIFLSDGTVISMPNRLDIDINDYFTNNQDKFLMIENTFKRTDMYKFHIHPNDVTFV